MRSSGFSEPALIGEGGMGQVYQATDTKLNRGQRFLIMKMARALPGREHDSQVVLNRERELLERVP